MDRNATTTADQEIVDTITEEITEHFNTNPHALVNADFEPTENALTFYANNRIYTFQLVAITDDADTDA